MALEIECKIYLTNAAALHHRLQQHQAIVTVPRVYEKNIRYENVARDFVAQGIVLRLRQDHHAKITYKAPTPHSHVGLSTRLELETTIGDLEVMDGILQHLGFSPSMTYEKYRTTYHLPTVPDAEIVFDEMPYGLFIEVEGPPESIDRVLQLLELDHAPRIAESYIRLFDLVKKNYQLDFTDLTFANFAGLTIDFAPILQELFA